MDMEAAVLPGTAQPGTVPAPPQEAVAAVITAAVLLPAIQEAAQEAAILEVQNRVLPVPAAIRTEVHLAAVLLL